MLDEKDHKPRRNYELRPPKPEDGISVSRLISACPPLDENSLYCNLLQCSHFAQTCALAEHRGGIDGFVSGYIPPGQPDTLFIWQVAVAAAGRGQGLAKRLIRHILERPVCRNVRFLDTTITSDNRASWAMFEGLARTLDAPTTTRVMFDREAHFDGRHASEHLLRIGPFDVAAAHQSTRVANESERSEPRTAS
ncbi:MAG: diaminobutyrate acetyltransferase [Alphaproteobacteria bacterium]|nr:MAG: diaminobutyrate acetyltransferase [Alphaproteobacteria bacterium]